MERVFVVLLDVNVVLGFLLRLLILLIEGLDCLGQ